MNGDDASSESAETIKADSAPHEPAVEVTMPNIGPDVVLYGRYRVIREFGRGGIGVVLLVLVAMLAFWHPSLWAEEGRLGGPGKFIEQLSPDGQFAVLREVTAASEGAMAERSKLISLPDKRVVIPALASAEAPENGMRRLLWAPDSKRFALHVEMTQRVDTTVIFQRNGEEFVEVFVLPQWEPSREAIAKRARKLGWKSAIPTSHIEDSVEPLRWLAPDALRVKALHKRNYTNESREVSESFAAKCQWTATFDSKGHAKNGATSGVKIWLDMVEDEPSSTTSPNGNYAFEADSSLPEKQGAKWRIVALKPRRILGEVRHAGTWSPDSSAALIFGEKVEMVQIIEGPSLRVIDLGKQVEQLFLPEYRRCHPEAAVGAEKFVITSSGKGAGDTFENDWVFDDAGNVVIQCEASAVTAGKTGSRTTWLTRLDAVWSVKEAKFAKAKITRGLCENPAADD